MRNYPTFADYVAWRTVSGGGREGDLADWPGDAWRDPVEERFIFKGLFKAVNPSRPVSPLNSRSLAAPAKTKRLGSQVMGR